MGVGTEPSTAPQPENSNVKSPEGFRNAGINKSRALGPLLRNLAKTFARRYQDNGPTLWLYKPASWEGKRSAPGYKDDDDLDIDRQWLVKTLREATSSDSWPTDDGPVNQRTARTEAGGRGGGTEATV